MHNPTPPDWLEDREFYEAMQAYRHAKDSITYPGSAMTAFEAVKTLIRKRTERCIPSKELEGLPDPLPMPPLPKTVFSFKRPVAGTEVPLYDTFSMHSYAVAYADASMRALLGIKAPVATPVVCPYDEWKPAKAVA